MAVLAPGQYLVTAAVFLGRSQAKFIGPRGVPSS